MKKKKNKLWKDIGEFLLHLAHLFFPAVILVTVIYNMYKWGTDTVAIVIVAILGVVWYLKQLWESEFLDTKIGFIYERLQKLEETQKCKKKK